MALARFAPWYCPGVIATLIPSAFDAQATTLAKSVVYGAAFPLGMRKMVDKIKNSIDKLEPLGCPKCGKPMSWFSSQLIEYSPVVIEHAFYCSCGAKKTTKDTRPGDSVSPFQKLCLPQIDQAA